MRHPNLYPPPLIPLFTTPPFLRDIDNFSPDLIKIFIYLLKICEGHMIHVSLDARILH